jgi:hypothetical protein
MTVITILNGDFEILFEDETVGGNAVAGMKMVRRTSTASATKYTTNALYSAVADAADDFQAMGFENPMLPVTPNAYTMENDYFIPRSSTEWLDEGAISADWDQNIRSILYVAGSPGAEFVVGDIGRQVTGGTTGDTGTLLDFETLPDGTTLAWIRPDDPTTDLFDDAAETLSVTGDGGNGSVTSTAVSTTGTSLYSSIQVIGSVPTATEVYLIQERQKMTDSEGNFQWWTTDTTVSLGIIDILIRVQRDGTYIADGDVEVFARRYTALYDNFRLNVAAGGRSALPLASAPDINNTTGYRVMTASGATGTFTIGNIIYDATASPADIADATKIGVITAVDSTTPAAPIIEYYLVGDLTDFAGAETIQEYDTTLFANSDAVATAGAPAFNPNGPTDPGVGQGGTVTISIGNTTVDHDGDATAEPYSITIDAQGDVPAARVYERIKYVTRRGQDNTFWNGTQPNVPGETYRGLELQAQYTAGSPSAFTEGDDITGPGGYTARVLSNNVTDTYVMVTDQQTSLDSIGSGSVITDESSDTVTIDSAPVAFTSPKQSPFGTFTGSQIFGARGVVYINPNSSDTQNYILTDDNGIQRTPPNTVAFTVNNTVSGDRVFVARDTGTAGLIDKDQFGGIASAAFNGTVLTVAGTIDTEVAESGFIRVVENTLQEEHHYVYDSRVSGAAGTFTLRNVNEGTGVTTASAVGGSPLGAEEALLIDTSATFLTAPVVEIGMLVRNTTVGKTTHVWEVVSVDSTTQLTVRRLYGPLDATQDWDVTDTYVINTFIGDHTTGSAYAAGTDHVFDLIIDQEATGTSVTNTFVKTFASDFGVVVNVRQGKVILPFTQNPTVGDSGGSVTVVRTPDTIAT